MSYSGKTFHRHSKRDFFSACYIPADARSLNSNISTITPGFDVHRRYSVMKAAISYMPTVFHG